MNNPSEASEVIGPNGMDFQKTEAAIQNGYRVGVTQYRLDDEIEVKTPHHQYLASILSGICRSFGRPISVLDLGCGTGRYFYCLENVERLVGMDITDEMLIAAENPVNAVKITARNIQLIRGNAFLASFAPQSFDLIYSLGMFGHGCPVTEDICNKLFKWLSPGGHLYFDVVDVSGLAWPHRWKHRARKAVYPFLSESLRTYLDARQNRHVPFFGLEKHELQEIMSHTRFGHFAVTSRACESPLWQGSHLHCWAKAVPAHEQFLKAA
jgi:SAM-dependent methyltransferase